MKQWEIKIMGRSMSPTHKFLHIQQQKLDRVRSSAKFFRDS